MGLGKRVFHQVKSTAVKVDESLFEEIDVNHEEDDLEHCWMNICLGWSHFDCFDAVGSSISHKF